MLGTAVGGYRLVAQLGEGGMGTVYLAEHLLLGRRAAIKVLLPALSARADVVHRFFNEARAVTTIADPGIVQVFDFGYHTDGSAYLVMELLTGEPLDARLRRQGRLAPAEALHLGRQLASSLAAAHDRGIIHRDLKPENVFLVADREVAGGERVKILDFGIAKLTEDAPSTARTMVGALIGTPAYMSPEQCRASGEIDARSDIYALGCVLYHLLVGRPPFASDGVGEIIAAHLREPVVPASLRVPGLPPVIDGPLLRCLAKAPGDRYASMTEVAAALGDVLRHLAPGTVSAQLAIPYLAGATPGLAAFTAPPTPPTTLGGSAGTAIVPRAPARRGPLAAALVAAAALLAVLLALLPSGDPAPPATAAVTAAAPVAPDAPAINDAASPDAGVDADLTTELATGAVDAALPLDARSSSRARRREPRPERCAPDDHDCDGIPDE